jgi:hypothetical protein
MFNLPTGKLFVAFLLICFAIVAVTPSSKKPSSQGLDEAVKAMNSQLPRQGDRITRIDKIILDEQNRVLIYATITAHGKSDIDLPAFRKAVYESIRTSSCLNAQYIDLLKKYAVQLVYIYYDKYSEPLAEFVINNTDCQ